MKYVILIGDGMSDLPLKELGGKTPLEVAKTPTLDYLAKHGTCGWTSNVPKGLTPGSDVAAMSIFGYDPQKYYTGRGPLEAASLGVKIKKGDIAFRCNLVTIKDGKMADFTAGHIDTPEAKIIIKSLDKRLGSNVIRFYPGLSYRHLMLIRDRTLKSVEGLKCFPPHDITQKLIENYLPSGTADKLLKYLMKESIMILLEHPVNFERIKKGQKPANMIWLWGAGELPNLKPFKKQYGKSAAVITAVHLIKGLGKILGMENIKVPGVTGYLDTNYIGKATYALRALKKNDLAIVHVESPDETGHMGDLKGKIKAIEDFDSKVVKTVLDGLQKSGEDFRILVLPDHPTPIAKMTHTSDPVPFALFESKNVKSGKINGFSEKEFKKTKTYVKAGYKLMSCLLAKKISL